MFFAFRFSTIFNMNLNMCVSNTHVNSKTKMRKKRPSAFFSMCNLLFIQFNRVYAAICMLPLASIGYSLAQAYSLIDSNDQTDSIRRKWEEKTIQRNIKTRHTVYIAKSLDKILTAAKKQQKRTFAERKEFVTKSALSSVNVGLCMCAKQQQ